jgi:hypothetical protein
MYLLFNHSCLINANKTKLFQILFYFQLDLIILFMKRLDKNAILEND